MSALLDSLLAGHDDAASRAILDIGLPGPRSEAWKYTPLRAFERRTFSPARVIEADTGWLAGIPAPRIVFVNGFFDAALSDIDALPPGLDITHAVSYTHLDVYKRQTEGSVSFDGKDLLTQAPEERAADGVFLAFQYPVEIPGVNNTYFLRSALNAQRKARGEPELDSVPVSYTHLDVYKRQR